MDSIFLSGGSLSREESVMKNNTFIGFTPTEIIALLIVFVVLYWAVGWRMDGMNIPGQENASATRAAMQALKTALANFNADEGKFPFVGSNALDPDQYNAADFVALGQRVSTNVLVDHRASGINLGIDPTIYENRWKGPYMNSDPSEFMVDAWNSKIRYRYCNGAIWLHSKGPDGKDEFSFALNDIQNYHGDDIIMMVSRVKF